jgi:hypothetical protein
MKKRISILLGFLAVTAFIGCGRPARLANGQASFEALAQVALDALARKDQATLERLALSREEFERHVWPELPAARPKTNLTVNFVWSDVALRSRAQLARLLQEFGGQRFSLVKVSHRGKVVRYPSHTAYSDMQILVQDDEGQQRKLPLFGTIIEMDGRFKIYSFAAYD